MRRVNEWQQQVWRMFAIGLSVLAVTGCIEDSPLADRPKAAASDTGVVSDESRDAEGQITDSQRSVTIDQGVINPPVVQDSSVPPLDGMMVGDVMPGPEDPIDCVQTCDRVVTCARDQCDGTPLNSFARCVTECEDGTLDLSDVITADCFDLAQWACSGPYAANCNCEEALCQRACEKTITCLDEVCEEPIFIEDECVFGCLEQPQGFPAESLLAASCEDIQAGYCTRIFDIVAAAHNPTRTTTTGICMSARRRLRCWTPDSLLYPCRVTGNRRRHGMDKWVLRGLILQWRRLRRHGVCTVVTESGLTACLARCDENTPAETAISVPSAVMKTPAPIFALPFDGFALNRRMTPLALRANPRY